ncbi:MAG: nucleotidyltransferase domain-containing protein [Myxococcales bacterium]|nr:nucleotidyltransferase domain-containing protein [Myxococcales bacterium]
MWLFGSLAWGEPDASADIDIAVKRPHEVDTPIRRLRRSSALLLRNRRSTYPVDIFTPIPCSALICIRIRRPGTGVGGGFWGGNQLVFLARKWVVSSLAQSRIIFVRAMTMECSYLGGVGNLTTNTTEAFAAQVTWTRSLISMRSFEPGTLAVSVTVTDQGITTVAGEQCDHSLGPSQACTQTAYRGPFNRDSWLAVVDDAGAVIWTAQQLREAKYDDVLLNVQMAPMGSVIVSGVLVRSTSVCCIRRLMSCCCVSRPGQPL